MKQKDVISKLKRELHWAQSLIQQGHNIASSGTKYSAQAHQLNTMAQSGLRDLQDDQAELTRLREQVAKEKASARENLRMPSSPRDVQPGPDEAPGASPTVAAATHISHRPPCALSPPFFMHSAWNHRRQGLEC